MRVVFVIVGGVVVLVGLVLVVVLQFRNTGASEGESALKLPFGFELKSKNPAVAVMFLGAFVMLAPFFLRQQSAKAKTDDGAAKAGITYEARLGDADHCTSRGVKLESAAAILQQDRANYHRFKKIDPQDQPDEWFADEKIRSDLGAFAARADSLTPAMQTEILNGTPTVRVKLGGQLGDMKTMLVELLERGPEPAPCPTPNP